MKLLARVDIVREFPQYLSLTFLQHTALPKDRLWCQHVWSRTKFPARDTVHAETFGPSVLLSGLPDAINDDDGDSKNTVAGNR